MFPKSNIQIVNLMHGRRCNLAVGHVGLASADAAALKGSTTGCVVDARLLRPQSSIMIREQQINDMVTPPASSCAAHLSAIATAYYFAC
jgi:hypothetical protein